VTSEVVIIYFTIIVFAGAFFLLNLTLAVINSKFTEAHNAHAETKNNDVVDTSQYNDDDMEMAAIPNAPNNSKDDMSISQFITARIYAKKMIEFLRMR
jgi:preprotein translocase subunit SecG